ncbi:NACHT domain-containing protein [Actinoplanes regularis]|uniref:NACHT domain-containing protein n=1 Tax=Actinoplanes regularis TaxID=52697 RepID=A0A239E147_9ACTN|nr:NACHT domain-containing protein [Actinoplanes regularis]GIE88925.1 hypothetical protein Are01nite_54050 [Actinoplanes regularis]SNS37723.1 NACHT domain-containing protein [Actinoplanes regularis]
MTAVRALLVGVVMVGVVAGVAVLTGGDPLDTMDKVSSVGAFAVAVMAVVVAWRQRPRAHKAAPRMWPSRHRHRYFTWLIARNRDLDIRGLGTQGPYSLEVENVYVDVSLVPRPIHQATGDPLAKVSDEPMKRREVWSFLTEWPPRTLAIVGPPGGGKTTLLKHLTLALASGRPPTRSLGGRIPVFLAIRDQARAISENPDLPLVRPLTATMPKELAGAGSWVERQLRNGNCLIMFDGLDEVADPVQRRLVSAWVERQIAAHHTNGFVITSRPYGYQNNPLTSADVLQVRPFTDDQIERFILRWYTATGVRRTGRRDDVVLSDARQQADDLLQRLRDNLHLYELAVNPLLLTMIAHVHNYRGVLPGGRAELYREICQVFLGGRQAAKGLTSDLTADQRESVLRQLALEMMKARKRDIEEGAAARLIRAQLARVAPGVQPEVFLTETEQQSGLLLQRESGVYAFAHLTFQEYLAAVRLRERGRDTFLAERTDDQWWREVTLLYCANTDAGTIVEACLREDSARSLLLASDCAEVARELDPLIRDRLEQVLSAGAQSADVDRAAVVGEVMLVRKLRRVRRLGAGVVLVDAPITNAEFDLFLRVTMAPEHWPVHWTSSIAVRHPDLPVTGLTSSAKVPFCSWASSVTEWSYEAESTPGAAFDFDPDALDSLGTQVVDCLSYAKISGNYRRSKDIFLGGVMSPAGGVGPGGKEIVEQLSDEMRLVTEADLSRGIQRISDRLRAEENWFEALRLLSEVQSFWFHWQRDPAREPVDLMPLLVSVCRLAESAGGSPRPSLFPEVVAVLDSAVMLYWWASGAVTPTDQFWLRRG